MDVLHRQAWIGLVEPDRSAIRRRCKVNELLKVLLAWRGWRVLGELEDKIEDMADVLGEIGNVFVERAVIDREETDLVVLKRHELREVGCADTVQVFGCPASPRAQEQFYLEEGKS